MTTPLRTGVFNAMGRGLNARIVAERGHAAAGSCAAEAFVASNAMADRIEKNGLRGESFAIHRGGAMEYLVDLLLARENLTRDDVTIVPLQQNSAVASESELEALRFTQEPLLTQIVNTGKGRIVATLEEVSPGQQLGLVAFGPRLIADRDLGVRFMRAYQRGLRQYHQGKTARNVQIVSKYANLPEDVVRRSCWQTVNPEGRLDPATLEPFFEWARQNEYLEPGMPVQGWWDPSFIDAATRP
jgi:ABC-type nitrate/sulfonate/bicarbonate transport system substrate-binding protein